MRANQIRLKLSSSFLSYLSSLTSISFITTATLLGLSSEVGAATINFFDDTFNDSDWIVDPQLRSGPPDFTVNAEQKLTGGDPGAYRQLDFTWGNNTAVNVFNLNQNAIYDPSIQGAIESIDFSYSTIGFGFGGVYGDNLLLQQDGVLFSNAFTAQPFANVWRTISGTFDPDFFGSGLRPDFSESGSPITFGYVRSNRIPGPVRTLSNGIDNWSVTINIKEATPVPEPTSTLSLLALGTLGAGSTLLRKKKHKLVINKAS